MKIERFENLEVWQLARELVKSIYKITSATKFSKDVQSTIHYFRTKMIHGIDTLWVTQSRYEKFGLTDHIDCNNVLHTDYRWR